MTHLSLALVKIVSCDDWLGEGVGRRNKINEQTDISPIEGLLLMGPRKCLGLILHQYTSTAMGQ